MKPHSGRVQVSRGGSSAPCCLYAKPRMSCSPVALWEKEEASSLLVSFWMDDREQEASLGTTTTGMLREYVRCSCLWGRGDGWASR